MGEHRYNPKAIASKNGELKPKQKTCVSKADAYKMLYDYLYDRLALSTNDCGIQIQRLSSKGME